MLLATVVAGALTLPVALLPALPFAVRSPEMHVALETASAAIALLAAGLAAGRFLRTRLRRDLALALAFALFGAANIVLAALPDVLPGAGHEAFETWATLSTRLTAAAVFAAAAWSGTRTVPPRWAKRAAIGAAAYFGATVVVFLLLRNTLPAGVGLVAGDTPFDASVLRAHPAVTANQVGALALYALACIGFLKHGRHDCLPHPWLAGAALLAAVARVHYIFFPSLYSEVVYSGDALRFSFYAFVLVASTLELLSYQRALKESATAEERRRIARELHDGLAPELSFIRARATTLTHRVRDESLPRDIASAAERALDEARHAISELTEPGDRPLGEALARAAEDVTARFGVSTKLAVPESARCDPAVRAQLLRIAREATTNAARHGSAKTITLALGAEGEHLILDIRDDGAGFDATRPTSGFGLTSMRERAEALGGAFELDTAEGRGTWIRVRIPQQPPAS